MKTLSILSIIFLYIFLGIFFTNIIDTLKISKLKDDWDTPLECCVIAFWPLVIIIVLATTSSKFISKEIIKYLENKK